MIGLADIFLENTKNGVGRVRKCLIAVLVAIGLVCAAKGMDLGSWQIMDLPPKIAENNCKMVNLVCEGGVYRLDLEEAVVGYLAGEMSAAAPMEALRAQAVAVRSFAWAEQAAAGQICGESGHCMAYLSAEERAARWGEKFDEYEERLREAVRDTAGEMLLADGVAVKAYFSAACGGRTETVDNLWGGKALWQAADCYWEGNGAVLSSVYFSREEIAEKLGVAAADVPLLCVAQEFDGRVCRVSLGRKSWRGAELRNLLGLKSTRFCWLNGAEGVWFTCVGHGHGVGLCQAGAVGMARAGWGWREILAHYYPGLVVGDV